ncbi:MAG: ATP-binding protein [Alkalispirochaeta sp.]
MIGRRIETTVQRLREGFPIVGITGPRQSGKTTLARALFSEKPYVSLEDPDTRRYVESDPRGFLAQYSDGAVIDEAQRVPELFSYLQSHVDLDGRMGRYVLTGSQQFGLLAGITQSLAGRVGMVTLLPFSWNELDASGQAAISLEKALFTGGYPPLYDRLVAPRDWFPQYITTYVERDLRQLIQVRDLSAFQTFVRMCAGRAGQILNLSGLADDCGITHNTAKAWISVLEASFLVFLLHPQHRNFNKRLIKSPKLYFTDTGLLTYLLGIDEPARLATHAMRGPIFENWIVAELMKGRFNRGLSSNLTFWRDRAGLEVDVIAERDGTLQPIEIKSGATIATDFFKGITAWCALSAECEGDSRLQPTLFYGGSERQLRSAVSVLPWSSVGEVAQDV